MRRLLRHLLPPLLALLAGAAAMAAEAPALRAAVLQIGTVNWELQTILSRGLDRAHGFRLVVQPYADNGATRVALEGGTADVAVADWIWAARQRAAGKDYVFLPYSRATGGLVVPADSPVHTLTDLRGRTLGIAGGPLDKSWLILQAYAARVHGFDLRSGTEQVFGAPPLMFRAGLSGDTDAVINFWHFLARMKARGMREIISVSEATRALGLNPDTPLVGYVLKEGFLRRNPGLAQAFHDAARDARTLLSRDDAAWDALRPIMNAGSEAEFDRLRADFRAGIPPDAPIDRADAARFLSLMAEIGGSSLVGQATTLPDGLFADVR